MNALRGFGVDKSVVNRTGKGAEKLDKKKLLKGGKIFKYVEINSTFS